MEQPQVSRKMANFHDLTAELVDLVAAHVDAPTLCTFRLASRACYDGSLHQFSNVLRQIRYLNAPFSLNALLGISCYQYLAAQTRCVRLSTAYVEADNPDFDIDHLPPSLIDEEDSPSSDQQLERYEEYLAEQDSFVRGRDLAILMAIFNNLPALERIEVGEKSGYSTRDSSPCYGMQTFENDTKSSYCADANIRDSANGDDGLTHTSKNVLQALSLLRKPMVELTAFRTTPDIREPSGIDVSTMPTLDGLYAAGLRCAFQTLRKLEIQLGYFNWADRPAPDKMWLSDFVKLAPNLQHLHLSFDGWSSWDPRPERPYCDHALERFAKSVTLPHLTKLTISNVVTNLEVIRSIYNDCRERSVALSLVRVLLRGARWDRIIPELLPRQDSAGTSVHLAWLTQLAGNAEDPAQPFDEDIVVFDERDISECARCKGRAAYLDLEPCRHMSYTIDQQAQVPRMVVWPKDAFF